jgi:hypothetical protein
MHLIMHIIRTYIDVCAVTWVTYHRNVNDKDNNNRHASHICEDEEDENGDADDVVWTWTVVEKEVYTDQGKHRAEPGAFGWSKETGSYRINNVHFCFERGRRTKSKILGSCKRIQRCIDAWRRLTSDPI